MGLGTNNKDVVAIAKDKVKAVLFALSTKKYQDRKILQEAKSIDEIHSQCNRLLGVHQSKFEITSLCKLIGDRKPEIICEIGTANGGTNLFLAHALPSVKDVIGIDLYVKNKTKSNFFLRNVITHFIDGSSYDTETVNKVKKILQDRKIDLLFIDGDHRYEGVKSDFESYVQLVKPGGLICFHDIVPDYLKRFNKFTGMWVGEVPEYWNELKNEYTHEEIIENPEQDGQGIGVIFKV